jgi:hypothetical protein
LLESGRCALLQKFLRERRQTVLAFSARCNQFRNTLSNNGSKLEALTMKASNYDHIIGSLRVIADHEVTIRSAGVKAPAHHTDSNTLSI